MLARDMLLYDCKFIVLKQPFIMYIFVININWRLLPFTSRRKGRLSHSPETYLVGEIGGAAGGKVVGMETIHGLTFSF